jgi:acylphosphatase
MPPDDVRLSVFVRGRVQGVGFRWWTRARALELGLVGFASNLPDGRVQVVAEGPRSACDRLLVLLGEQPSSFGRPGEVTGVTDQWSAARPGTIGFVER